MVEHRVGWLDPVFQGLSWVGEWGAVWLLLAAVLALARRRPGVFVAVALADLAAQLASTGLKHAFGRHRPHLDRLVSVSGDLAFPSGHAASSFACAAVIAFAYPRLTVPLAALAIAISFSRVYVGVHYPLDVLGGAVLGLAIATALRLLAGARRRSRRAQPAG